MNIEKLIQVTGYLLKKYDKRRLNYIKLIKELYLADREFIDETNSSITEDTYVSMKYGPVLNNLYTLIKGKCGDIKAQAYWDSRFSMDGDELLANFDQYPEGKLSKAEKETLDKIDGLFHQKQSEELIDYVHATCPEWRNPDDDIPLPINLEDILTALGRNADQIDWILEETKAFEEDARIFDSLAVEA